MATCTELMCPQHGEASRAALNAQRPAGREPRTLTDWRGTPYTIGTTIVYPRASRRSYEMQEGVVLNIWDAVYDFDRHRWVRVDPDGDRHEDDVDRERTTKVRVQPVGSGSRDFFVLDERLAKDEDGNVVLDANGAPTWEPIVAHPLTLEILENITVVTPAGDTPKEQR